MQDAQMTPIKSKGDRRDVELNCEGNVVAMQKINPASLPKNT